MRLYFIYIFLITPIWITGQSISGMLKDPNNNPLAYINISVLAAKDSIFRNGSISNEKGYFSIENLEPSTYNLNFSSIGFKNLSMQVYVGENNLDLGTIIMEEEEITLNEVVVVKSRPQIKLENNKLIIKVDSILAKGNMVSDILSQSPGVFVRPNGKISLLGNTNVIVYVNRRRIDPNAVYTLLSTINAEDIKAIEILNNSSSRFDASISGGIINITLKKNLLGFSGNISSTISQGIFFKSRNSFNLNYGINTMNIFGTYNFNDSKSFEKTEGKIIFNTPPTTTRLERSTNAIINSYKHLFRFGADYSLRKTAIIGVLTGNFYNEFIPQQNDSEIIQSSDSTISTTKSKSNNQRDDFSVNLNLTQEIDTLGSRLFLDYLYSNYKIDNSSSFNTEFEQSLMDELLTSINPNISKVNAIQIELNKNFKNQSVLILGYKFNVSNIDNDVDFFRNMSGVDSLDNQLSNSFQYHENINAYYSEYSGKFSKKLSYLFSLRMEDTSIEAIQENNNVQKIDYLDYFPSLSIGYVLSSKHKLSLTFSRKIGRPRYNNLNPFIYYVDPYTFIVGNPELKPQYGNYFRLNYLINKKYYLTFFHNTIDDVFMRIPIQADDTISTSLQVTNLERSNQAGISISVPYKSKWWIINNNILFYNKNFIYSSNLSKNLSNSRNVFEFSQSNTFILPIGLKIDVSGFYVSPFVEGVYRTDSFYSINLAFRKSFLKNKLDCKLSFVDIFYSYRLNSETILPNQKNISTLRTDSRRISFQMVYRFKTGKEGQKIKERNINTDILKRL